MKGNIKVTVTEVTEHQHFPITKTFSIEQDNTWEGVEDWIEAFRAILLVQGFHYGTVNEFIPDPTDEPLDSNQN